MITFNNCSAEQKSNSVDYSQSSVPGDLEFISRFIKFVSLCIFFILMFSTISWIPGSHCMPDRALSQSSSDTTTGNHFPEISFDM